MDTHNSNKPKLCTKLGGRGGHVKAPFPAVAAYFVKSQAYFNSHNLVKASIDQDKYTPWAITS